MTINEFELALRNFCRRRPFRSFLIEFSSGHQMMARHPEAVDLRRGLFVLRSPDGGYAVFAAESVVRVLDFPVEMSSPSITSPPS